jgi:hypothetical protein
MHPLVHSCAADKATGATARKDEKRENMAALRRRRGPFTASLRLQVSVPYAELCASSHETLYMLQRCAVCERAS